MIKIELIAPDLRKLGAKFASITTQIQSALKSNVAIDVAALIPGGTAVDTELQGVCALAIKGCQALEAIGDNAGVLGRLSRLGTDLTALEHGGKHGFAYYLEVFETCLADLTN